MGKTRKLLRDEGDDEFRADVQLVDMHPRVSHSPPPNAKAARVAGGFQSIMSDRS
jgi:hypothetical protein